MEVPFILHNYSNITTDSSEFSNNSAFYASGGALYMHKGNGDFEVQINDTVFIGNRVHQGSGGAQ